ncbi:uncharacterized protein M421DRAFT_416692 [Didymella exigua CBS 183.55]|uniref:DUF4105 domain-containing protein n=1 Tax=Didymella exigua CBS 183.55 TaxID=1150837 RepID=A0A6A5S0V5_9PLEO|nr:uncharacterized protein M421DRAFT_416692 [Didymella exigua CBS 183.55]KAF1933104.1 hypothetical protein M421DRAFT_416692 [Didymella exigua CBS 183.55]
MKFHAPILLVASFFSYVSADVTTDDPVRSVRSHPRDFPVTLPHTPEAFQLSKRATPALPKGKDATKLHVWIRTDERPITYDERGGAPHEGLNQLMKDTGGRHKDIIVGNPSKGYWEYGLMFHDTTWQSKPNGDGAAVLSYEVNYKEIKNGKEAFQYMGQVKDGRKTHNSIATLAQSEIKGKTYNHKTYNCATFAIDLTKKLV